MGLTLASLVVCITIIFLWVILNQRGKKKFNAVEWS